MAENLTDDGELWTKKLLDRKPLLIVGSGLLLLVVLLLMSSSQSQAATYVWPSGTYDITTTQNYNPGDTIYVESDIVNIQNGGVVNLNGATLIFNVTDTWLNVGTVGSGYLNVTNNANITSNDPATIHYYINVTNGGTFNLTTNSQVNETIYIRLGAGSSYTINNARINNATEHGLNVNQSGKIKNTVIENIGINALMIEGLDGYLSVEDCSINNADTAICFDTVASSDNFWLNNTDLVDYDSDGIWVALDSPGLAVNLNNVDFLPNAGSQYGVRVHNASGVRDLGWLNLTDVNFVGNGASMFAVYSANMYYGVEFLNVTSEGYDAGFCLGKGSLSPYFYFTNVLLRGVSKSADFYGICVYGVFSGDVQMTNVTVRDFAPTAFNTIGINLDLVNSVSVFEDVLVENIPGDGIIIRLTDSAPFTPSNLVINNTCTSDLENALFFSGSSIVLDSTVKITNNSGGSALYISGCPNVDMDLVYIYNNGINTNSETIVFRSADGIISIDSCTIVDNKGTPIYFRTGASDAKFWLNDTDLVGYETHGIWVGVNCPDLEINLNNVDFIPDSVTVTQYGIYADNDLGWLNLTDVNFIGTNEFPQSVYAFSIYHGVTFENVTADGYGRGFYLRRGGSGSPNYNFFNVSLAGVSDSGGVTPDTNGFFVFGNGAGDVKMSNVTVRDFTSTTAKGIYIQQVDSISLFEDILVDNTLADGVYILNILGGSFAPENLIINDTCNNDNNQYALYVYACNGVTLDGTTTIKITNNTGGALYLSSCQDISINDVTFAGNGFNIISRTIEFVVCTGFMAIDDCVITDNDGTPISFTTSGSVGSFWLNNTDLINYTQNGIEVATDCDQLDINLNNVNFIPDAVTATQYGIYANSNLGGLDLFQVNFVGTNEQFQSVYAFSMFQDITFENVTADGYGRGYYIKRSSGSPNFNFYNVSLAGVTDSVGASPSTNGFFVFGNGAGDVEMSNVTVRDFSSTTARGIFIQQVDSISLFEDILVDNTLADGVYIFNIFGSSFTPENLIINNTCNNDNSQSALYVWISNGVTLDGTTTIKITNNTGTALNLSSCQDIKITDVILENNGFNMESETINFTSCSGFMAIDDCVIMNNKGTSIYFGIPGSSGGFWLNNTDLIDYTRDGIRVGDHCPSLTLNLNNVDFMPQAASAYGIYCYDGGDTELGWLYLTEVNFAGNGATAHAVYAQKMLQEVRFENVVADGYARGFYFANGSEVTNYYFTNVSLSGVSNGEPEDGLYASGNSTVSEVQMMNVTVKDFTSLSAIGIYLKDMASVMMSQYILVENVQMDGIFLENVENVVIENCTVRDLTSSSTIYAGIHFASPVSDITIRDTTIDDTGRYGIYIQGAMNPGTLTLDHVDILNYSDGSGRGFMSNNHLTDTDVMFSNVTVSKKIGFSPDHGILFWGEVKTLLLDNVTVGNPAEDSQYYGIQVGIGTTFGVREWLDAKNVEVFGYQRGIVIFGDDGMTPSFNFWDVDIHDINSGLSAAIGLQIESHTGGWANLTRVNVYDITGPVTGHGIKIESSLQMSMNDVWVNNTQGGGIYAHGQGDFSPKYLTITNNGATGLFITGFTSGTIDGTNIIYNNTYDGIHIQDADNILIHNTTIQRNGKAAGYAGIHIQYTSGIMGNLTLQDLTLEDNGQYGVFFEGTLTAGTVTMERVNIWNYTGRGVRGGDQSNTDFLFSNMTLSMKLGSGADHAIELYSNVKSIILDNITAGNPSDMATNYAIRVGTTAGVGPIELAILKNIEIFNYAYGIFLGSGSENVSFDIQDIKIHNISWSGLTTYGIQIKSDMGGWVNLTNINVRDIICTLGSYALYIVQGQTTSPTVHARDITITNMSDGRGIGISVGNDSLLENVIITGIGGGNSWGVIVKEATGCTLTFLDISMDNIHGAFYGDGALDDVWIINSSFANMNTYNYYLQAANEHVTSLNTTLDAGASNNIGDDTTSNLTIAWYCSLFIVNTTGDMLPVSPVNIAFNDTFSANHLTTINNVNGYLNWTIIKEEVIGLNAAYYSPYTIEVWNSTLQNNLTADMNQSRWYVISMRNVASVNWVLANGMTPYDKPWSLDSFELTANATHPSDNIIEIRYNTTLSSPDQGILVNPTDGSYDDNPWEEVNATIDTSDKGIWAVSYSYTFYVWAYNGVEWSAPISVVVTVYDDSPPDTSIVQANGTIFSWVKPWSYDWFTLSAYTDDLLSGDQNITAVEYFKDGTGPSGTGNAMPASDGTYDSPDEWGEITIDTSDKGIWAPGTTHTFFVHGFDGTNWGSYLTVEVLIGDDVAPETQDVTADYQNPLLASYPWDIITIRATINDTLGANQTITAAEYFVDAPGSDGTGNAMVVDDSVWDSPVELVRAGVDVSSWAFGESHTYYIHGMDEYNWGSFLTVTITKPSIDTIDIVSDPGSGLNPIGDMMVPVGFTYLGFSSAHNGTAGYLGDVVVNWSAEGNTTSFVDMVLSDFSTIYIGLEGGIAYWNASIYYEGEWYNDTVVFTVLTPTLDSIVITDQSGSSGTEIQDGNIPIGYTARLWAAAYNDTAGVFDNLDVTWTIINTSGAQATIDNLTGSNTTLYAGLEAGIANITIDDGLGHNDTVELTILPPTIDFLVITDSPNGAAFDTENIDIGGQVTAYVSAYNSTGLLYLGVIEVNWMDDPDLGTFDNDTGTNTIFTGGFIGGATTIKAENLTLGLNDTFTINIAFPTVNYLIITDAPNGAVLTTLDIYIGEQVKAYASGYNNTGATYVGLVELDWTDDPDLGSFDNDTGVSTIFTAGYAGGTTTIKAENLTLGLNDTFTINIAFPTVNYIIITDAPNGAVLTTVNIDIGGQIVAYASGYNNTGSTYTGLVDVDWTDDPGLGAFDNETGTSTTFTAGFGGGATAITGQSTPLAISDFFTINIAEPTLDFIIITDSPDGNGLTTFSIGIGGQIIAYASGYNMTGPTYIGLVNMDWNDDPDLGSFDNDTWTNTVFTAGIAGGAVTVTAQNTTLDLSDTFTVNIADPTVNYITITDASNGAELVTANIDVGGQVTVYVSGYNSTGPTFVGLVSVEWSGTGGTWSQGTGQEHIFTAGISGGTFTQTCQNTNLGVSETLDIIIAHPTVDEIRLVDDEGNEIDDISLDPGDSITIYARGYNATLGDIGSIDVDWSVSGGATLSTATGSSTTITAGDDGGSYSLGADYDEVSASIDLDVSKISEEEPEEGIPIWLLVLVIVIIVILLLILLMTRRKEAEELPPEAATEEPAEIEHIDIDDVLEILKEEKDWDEEKLEKAKRTMERVNELGEEK